MSHKYVLLKEVCEKASSNIAQKDLAECDGIYPIYGASGYIKSVDFFQQAKDYIAIVKDGAGIGRAMKLPAKSSVIGTMQYVLPKDNINISYLYYAICSMHLEKYFSGATIPHIYFRDYQNEQLPWPTLEEQAKIANVFGRIDYFIKKEKEQLINLDKLVKSRFVEMFGELKSNSKKWVIEPFDYFATIDGNMTTDFVKYANYPHIGIDSIEKNSGILKGYKTVKEDGVKSGKYIFNEEHIIYSKIRPNLNKVALPDFEGLCSADAYPILVKKDVCNRIYLVYVMRSSYFLDYILAFSSRTNMPKVNRAQVKGFSMPLPPVQLQNQFASFVMQVDKSKFVVTAKFQ